MSRIRRIEESRDEWRGARHEAEQVPCPECDAEAAEHCRNLADGGELGRLPAHWRRIKASELYEAWKTIARQEPT